RSQTYNEAEQLLPKGAQIASTPLSDTVKSTAQSLRHSTQKTLDAVKRRTDAMSKLGRGGKYPVEDLILLKKGINEDLALRDITPIAKNALGKLKDEINSTLAKYGKINPEWYKKYYQADELHGALKNTEGITKFLKEHFDVSKYLSQPLTNTLLFSGIT